MVDLSNFIHNKHKPIDSEQSISDLKIIFENYGFSHFPVLDSDVYIGNILYEDINEFDSSKKIVDYQYAFEIFFAKDDMIWMDVLNVFAKNNSNLLPVLNQQNQYLGYYKLADFINFFKETSLVEENGKTLLLKKKTVHYSASEIAQIIESNNGKILGLFVSEIQEDNTLIVVKFNFGIVNEILQSFRRYDYEIVSKHDEDFYINNLKERSDYLNKYLNI